VLSRLDCSVKLRHFRISAGNNLVEANRMSDVDFDLEIRPRPKTDGTHLLADRPSSIVTELPCHRRPGGWTDCPFNPLARTSDRHAMVTPWSRTCLLYRLRSLRDRLSRSASGSLLSPVRLALEQAVFHSRPESITCLSHSQEPVLPTSYSPGAPARHLA